VEVWALTVIQIRERRICALANRTCFPFRPLPRQSGIITAKRVPGTFRWSRPSIRVNESQSERQVHRCSRSPSPATCPSIHLVTARIHRPKTRVTTKVLLRRSVRSFVRRWQKVLRGNDPKSICVSCLPQQTRQRRASGKQSADYGLTVSNTVRRYGGTLISYGR
jgi:hypothetical protein